MLPDIGHIWKVFHLEAIEMNLNTFSYQVTLRIWIGKEFVFRLVTILKGRPIWVLKDQFKKTRIT